MVHFTYFYCHSFTIFFVGTDLELIQLLYNIFNLTVKLNITLLNSKLNKLHLFRYKYYKPKSKDLIISRSKCSKSKTFSQSYIKQIYTRDILPLAVSAYSLQSDSLILLYYIMSLIPKIFFLLLLFRFGPFLLFILVLDPNNYLLECLLFLISNSFSSSLAQILFLLKKKKIIYQISPTAQRSLVLRLS